MFASAIRPLAAAALILSPVAVAQSSETEWQHYLDPSYGFAIELPVGSFEPVPDGENAGLTLVETGGEGQLSLYGGPAQNLTLDEFAARLGSGEQVRTITYKDGGGSWFVLSGYYDAEPGQDPLIFYTKVMMSTDHLSFSAFEISYPNAEKLRFDPIIARLEASLTRPDSGRQ
jgi:hypothetical protein